MKTGRPELTKNIRMSLKLLTGEALVETLEFGVALLIMVLHHNQKSNLLGCSNLLG